MNRASAGKIAVTLFWHAFDIIAYGAAFKYLAGWYLTPVFHTLPITWPRAFGLVLLVRLLVQKHDDDRDITFQNIVVEALIPAIFTEAGFLIQHFLPT